MINKNLPQRSQLLDRFLLTHHFQYPLTVTGQIPLPPVDNAIPEVIHEVLRLPLKRLKDCSLSSPLLEPDSLSAVFSFKPAHTCSPWIAFRPALQMPPEKEISPLTTVQCLDRQQNRVFSSATLAPVTSAAR